MTDESIGKLVRFPSTDQIDTANKIRETLQGWVHKDKILSKLKQSDPNFDDFQITLCKVLAINDFYFARCSDTISATDKILELKVVETFRQINQNTDEIVSKQALVDLVNDIARHRRQSTDGDIVFASKFAYFFISDETFPILDDHAESMIQYYFNERQLGQGRKPRSQGERYAIFCDQFNTLKQGILALNSNYQLTNKQLDHFLWLAGMCEKLKQNSKSGVNPEFKKKFEGKDPLIMQLFDMLFPDGVSPRKTRPYRKRAK